MILELLLLNLCGFAVGVIIGVMGLKLGSSAYIRQRRIDRQTAGQGKTDDASE